jgi:hypothetical protein
VIRLLTSIDCLREQVTILLPSEGVVQTDYDGWVHRAADGTWHTTEGTDVPAPGLSADERIEWYIRRGHIGSDRHGVPKPPAVRFAGPSHPSPQERLRGD